MTYVNGSTSGGPQNDELLGPIQQPRMEVDAFTPIPGLELTWFDELDPLQQYLIAKHIYDYLERMVPDDLELAVRSPKLLDPEHRGSWLEFYLCQTLARTSARFTSDILEQARTWARGKVEHYAQMAKRSADELAKAVEEDQQFCAKIAMKSLQVQQGKQKAGRVKP